MISKAISIRSASAVGGLAVYLGSREHPSHRGLKAIRTEFFGLPGSMRTLTPSQAMVAVAERILEKKGSGRPREIAAWHLIVRTPENALLNEKEKNQIQSEIVREFGIKTGGMGWHDHYDGTSDVHIIALNQGETGLALKTVHDPSMRRKLTAVMDRVHNEINLARKIEGRPHIRTIPETRKKIALQLGYERLPALIVRNAKAEGISDWQTIQGKVKEWAQLSGHEVTRMNSDSISIRYVGRNKAHKHHWNNLKEEVMPLLVRREKSIDVTVPSDAARAPLGKKNGTASSVENLGKWIEGIQQLQRWLSWREDEAQSLVEKPPELDIDLMRALIASASTLGGGDSKALAKELRRKGYSPGDIKRRLRALSQNLFRTAMLQHVEDEIELHKARLNAWQKRELRRTPSKGSSVFTLGLRLAERAEKNRGREDQPPKSEESLKKDGPEIPPL